MQTVLNHYIKISDVQQKNVLAGNFILWKPGPQLVELMKAVGVTGINASGDNMSIQECIQSSRGGTRFDAIKTKLCNQYGKLLDGQHKGSIRFGNAQQKLKMLKDKDSDAMILGEQQQKQVPDLIQRLVISFTGSQMNGPHVDKVALLAVTKGK